jgi:hypothetical protein
MMLKIIFKLRHCRIVAFLDAEDIRFVRKFKNFDATENILENSVLWNVVV